MMTLFVRGRDPIASQVGEIPPDVVPSLFQIPSQLADEANILARITDEDFCHLILSVYRFNRVYRAVVPLAFPTLVPLRTLSLGGQSQWARDPHEVVCPLKMDVRACG